MLLQRIDEARFAQARLADEQDDLPRSLRGLLPAILEQTHLVVAARERRDLGRTRHLNGAARVGEPHDLKDFDRLRHALELPAAKIDAVEATADQAVGRLGAHDPARHGHIFQPHGDVSRLAHHRDRVVLRLHDRRPGVDAGPRDRLPRLRTAEISDDRRHIFDQGESGLHGSTGSILESDRVAEADEEPPFAALHDRPLEPTHGLLAHLLERSQQPGLVLRVEFQVRLGFEQVAAADEHRHLTPLGLSNTAYRGSFRGSLRRGRKIAGSGRRRQNRFARRHPDVSPQHRWRFGDRQELAAQFFGEVGGGGEAILLPLRERLETDALQFDGDVADDLARRLRLVVAYLPQQLQRVIRPERHPACQHLVEDDAETVDVGPAIDAVGGAGGLLGRHVVGSAGDESLLFAPRLHFVESEPEVDQHRFAVGGQEDVGRLDVAVDDLAGMRMGQGVGHRGGDPRRLRPVRAVVSQPVAEIGTVEEIGNKVDLSLVHADIMHRDDAGMPQPGEPARFLEEPIRIGLRQTGARVQNFDRHGPVELAVVAEKHGAEAAGSEGAPHLIPAESRRGCRRVGGAAGQVRLRRISTRGVRGRRLWRRR